MTDISREGERIGGTQRGATGIDREALARSLEQAWGDFVSDTGCHPDCFTWRNGKLFADFWTGNFAEMVASYLGMDRQVTPIYDEGWDNGSRAAWVHLSLLIRTHGDEKMQAVLDDWESRRNFGSSR